MADRPENNPISNDQIDPNRSRPLDVHILSDHPELNVVHDLLSQQKQSVMQGDKSVTGFNVGINAVKSAGQTVFHVYVHLILMRDSDVEEPRGERCYTSETVILNQV